MKKIISLTIALAFIPSLALAKAKETTTSPEMDRWVNCLVHKSYEYSKVDAPVETAAKGAMGACKTQELGYYDSLTKVSFADAMLEGKFAAKARKRQQAEDLRQRMREDFQEHTISLIMEFRSHYNDPSLSEQQSIDKFIDDKKAEFRQ